MFHSLFPSFPSIYHVLCQILFLAVWPSSSLDDLNLSLEFLVDTLMVLVWDSFGTWLCSNWATAFSIWNLCLPTASHFLNSECVNAHPTLSVKLSHSHGVVSWCKRMHHTWSTLLHQMAQYIEYWYAWVATVVCFCCYLTKMSHCLTKWQC